MVLRQGFGLFPMSINLWLATDITADSHAICGWNTRATPLWRNVPPIEHPFEQHAEHSFGR